MTIPAAHLSPPPRLRSRLLQFVLVLLGVQALRAVVAWPLWSLLRLADHDLRSNLISVLSFLIVGALLWLWRRPAAAELGLHWSRASRRERLVYAIGAGLLLALVLSSVTLDPGLLLVNIHSVLITPVFEELLFRGYGWGQLEAALSRKRAGLWTWLLTTALFGLWHLGYADHLLRLLPLHGETASLGVVLFWKVVIGVAVGFLAGWVRWRTGKVYGAVLVHGLWNLFGR